MTLRTGNAPAICGDRFGLALRAKGEDAGAWLDLAQVLAGRAGKGRRPTEGAVG
jgi:hypothetical protein